jgi:L,D-peptidoglycan transpeptidase YkuD (ErfK/YbiS/YcfS/YnhG family)
LGWGRFSLAALALVVSASVLAAELPWSSAKQLVLVITPGWDANQGSMRTFEKRGNAWHVRGNAVAVTIGRTGAAWGDGLHPAQPSGMKKREGDGRSPAGVFRIGDAFGYSPSLVTGLRYQPMTEFDYCVDVSGSSLYNQIVNAQTVGAAAVKDSTEPMRRDIHAKGDQRYKIGFVIEHNHRAQPGAGSCIFAHLWKEPGEPTAGCTAMDEKVMHDLVAWLRADQKPVFVLLPQHEYERLKSGWGLP